jgi:Acyl-CoA synthetases (AMP-forming)/AMP-acid ligases II
MSETLPQNHSDGDSTWAFHRPDWSAEHHAEWHRGLDDGALPDVVSQHARTSPNKLALVVDGDAVTYGELDHRIGCVATWLLEQGVSTGDRVLITGQNSVELLVACLSAMAAGGIAVVANPNLTAREIEHFLADATPRIAFTDGALATKFTSASARTPLAYLDRSDSARLGPTIHQMARAGGGARRVELVGSQLATLQYTSGTTGAPKGAMISHGQQLAHLRIIAATWRWSESDVLVHSLPLSHGHGLNGCYTALLSGATAVVLPRTDPARIVAAFEEMSATIFYSVPAIWERILSWDGFRPEQFKALRLFTSGSAPLSVAMSEQIRGELGSYPLERYGSTEAGPIFSNPLIGTRYPGTVGVTPPGVQSRIVDAYGEPVAAGMDGEIVARSSSVFSGYWGKDPDDADWFTGGWLRTGDVGRIDATTGFASITGRLKEMIITGGLNVYPCEVETEAERFPGVTAAAAVGIPSDKWGEEVVLAVVAGKGRADLDLTELDQFLRGSLAGYKVPKAYKVVDSVPRNHMGKIQRSSLVEGWDEL